MVNYLHSEDDAEAGKDLARIYDTRTLNKVHAVSATNKNRMLADVLSDRLRVVVPAEDWRLNDALLKVLRCLKMMGCAVSTVDDYLLQLNNQGAPATGPAHAKPGSSGAPLALPAGSG